MSKFLMKEELEEMKSVYQFLGEATDTEHAKNIIYDCLQHMRSVVVMKNPETSNTQANKLHKWIRINYFCTAIRGGWIVHKR